MMANDGSARRSDGVDLSGVWRRVWASVLAVTFLAAVLGIVAGPATARDREPIVLTSEDFRFGTYIIDRPGVYVLGEDISFNPNSPDALNSVIAGGVPAGSLGLEAPVDAYQAGMPLPSQFAFGPTGPFTPGGPSDPRYDPAAYGVGFFAAIAISADGVVLDLNGHTIEQSAEHALLQRFFAVIELADQPFLPRQGPSDFGVSIDSARDVTIRNGVIGRSSHHGIHGNDNEDVAVENVDFIDYEVAAVALNRVRGLRIQDSTATNRKDVPVLGTFSSAQFIKSYVNELARNGSPTTLSVGGVELDAHDIRAALRDSINNTHHDVIVEGRGTIDPTTNPAEYGLFHNAFGVVDGNSYSFLVNSRGVAVMGFPSVPDRSDASQDVTLRNVSVVDQASVINEVPAVDLAGAPVIDPVGAVFQIQNRHPDTGQLVTISPSNGSYIGNPVANAQAFVAKARANGEFASSSLDVSRLNIDAHPTLLDWVEGRISASEAGLGYLCNGDSMFHVNKGAIGFRMDGVDGVRLLRTSVSGLTNLGTAGTGLCGDYLNGRSHPAATLLGYGGNASRGYTFAGSTDVRVHNARIDGIHSQVGPAIAVDVLTDSSEISLRKIRIENVSTTMPSSNPTPPSIAVGVHVAPGATQVALAVCAGGLDGADGQRAIDDESAIARIRSIGSCEED